MYVIAVILFVILMGAVLYDVLEQMEVRIMATLDELKAQVAENTSVVNSVLTFIDGITAQLQAAQNDPAAIQALIDELKNSDVAMAKAVAANTSAELQAGVTPDGGTSPATQADAGADG